MTPTWVNMLAPIVPIKLASQGSTAWVTDGSSLHYYDPSSVSWLTASMPTTNSLTDLAASTDGSVMAVDSSGTYVLTLGSWAPLYISAYPTTSAAVGDINNFLIVDSITNITKSAHTINTLLAAGPTKVTTTAGLTNIWGITSAGAVNKYDPTSALWTAVTGKTLTQVHASLSSTNTPQIVGVDTVGKGWSYSGTAWTSILTPNVGDKYTSIQAGAGYIWAVLSTGAVYCGVI